MFIKSKIDLIGFLGADAKVETSNDGSTNYTVLSLATKESWKNRETDDWESRTEWHRIVVFGRLGDFAATLTKGAHIEVEGKLRSNERTVELKDSTKKNPKMHTYRTWSIVADSIRKLDRAERASGDETAAPPDSEDAPADE